MILVFVFTTTLFGSAITYMVRQKFFSTVLHLVSGWLVGSMLTGWGILFYTYFSQLTEKITMLIMVIQVLAAVVIFLMGYLINLKKKKSGSKLAIEKAPQFHFLLLFIGAIVLWINYNYYKGFPFMIPYGATETIEMEHSAMTSILSGVNFQRKHMFTIEDPMLANSTLTVFPVPIFYTAAMCTLDQSYVNIGCIISFLNSISTATVMYFFCTGYTTHPATCTILFLLNGGFAIHFLFSNRSGEIDLVHNVGREYNVPFYQILFEFLITSKTNSFVLPLAIFALSIIQTAKNTSDYYTTFILAGIMAGLVPNPFTLIAILIVGICRTNSFLMFVPFAAFGLLPQLFVIRLHKIPVWREYQMNGIFFSQIISWMEAFGPFFFYIFIFPVVTSDYKYIHRFISTLLALPFLSFFRNGNYIRDNALGAAAVVFPILVVGSMRLFETLRLKLKGRIKGIVTALFVGLFALSLVGGAISINRQCHHYVIGVREHQKTASEWVARHVPLTETIFTPISSFNPASFSAGRRILCGPTDDIWRRGENPIPAAVALQSIDVFDGAPEVMRRLGMRYLLEDYAAPLVSQNESRLAQFQVLGKNEGFALLRLRNL